MKKSILILSIAACSILADAKGISPVGVDGISFDRHGDYMVIDMTLDFKPTDVESSRAQVLTPLIISENGDTLALPSVGVYGRQRYIQYLRNGRHPLGTISNDKFAISNYTAASGNDQSIFKNSERPSGFAYHADTPYQDWMANSKLIMRRQLYGCADCLIAERLDPVSDYFQVDPTIPEIVYFQAKDTGAKIETLEGSAFVDFPVNQTIIYPEYRNNVRELGKIQSTIDTVYNDKDVTITGVWLKGYASPESPYSHNTDLAIGRTAALKKYISQLYKFPDNIMATDYEPEDWADLRRFVSNSNMDHKEEIIVMIDSNMEPDAKEAKIKRTYPAEYKFMLQNFYPALRHTDYRITYEIKRFDDLNKIREVMRTKPNRLSLREFFLLGNATEPGSDEFNDVYETAVRMYPDDPTANINAANAALQRRDFEKADQYLKRAGDSPEAIYARGSLAFLMEDYDKAEQLMNEALPSIPEAQSTLDEIAHIRANAKTVKKDGTKIFLE